MARSWINYSGEKQIRERLLAAIAKLHVGVQHLYIYIYPSNRKDFVGVQRFVRCNFATFTQNTIIRYHSRHSYREIWNGKFFERRVLRRGERDPKIAAGWSPRRRQVWRYCSWYVGEDSHRTPRNEHVGRSFAMQKSFLGSFLILAPIPSIWVALTGNLTDNATAFSFSFLLFILEN